MVTMPGGWKKLFSWCDIWYQRNEKRASNLSLCTFLAQPESALFLEYFREIWNIDRWERECDRDFWDNGGTKRGFMKAYESCVQCSAGTICSINAWKSRLICFLGMDLSPKQLLWHVEIFPQKTHEKGPIKHFKSLRSMSRWHLILLSSSPPSPVV